MLLGKGIFAGPGAEAQGGNQSSGFGLRGEAEEISEARACRPCERALFGEEFAGQRGIGGVQKQGQGIYLGWTRGCLACLFPNHLARLLVFPEAEKNRLSQPIIPRPFREFDLTNHRRFNRNTTLHFSDGFMSLTDFASDISSPWTLNRSTVAVSLSCPFTGQPTCMPEK
jgi:hypothetical protein